jgi:hypothetical protein
VHLHGVDIGAVEQGLVGAGIIGADAVNELVLAQEPARLRPGGLVRKRLRRRRGERDGGGRRRLGGERVWAFEAQ